MGVERSKVNEIFEPEILGRFFLYITNECFVDQDKQQELYPSSAQEKLYSRFSPEIFCMEYLRSQYQVITARSSIFPDTIDDYLISDQEIEDVFMQDDIEYDGIYKTINKLFTNYGIIEGLKDIGEVLLETKLLTTKYTKPKGKSRIRKKQLSKIESFFETFESKLMELYE